MGAELYDEWSQGGLVPHLLIVCLTGLVGLVIGSFLAAVSVRLPHGEDIVLGRSRCRDCQRTLAPHHLIPVVSWIALRGRCGWCSARISPRYLMIETAAAAVGMWSALAGSTWLLTVATALLGWQLLLIAIVDAEHFWLPDVLTWPLILGGLLSAACVSHAIPWSHVAGALIGMCGMIVLAQGYRWVRGRDGLGGGDPFVYVGAGAWVGWAGLASVMLWACLAGLGIVLAALVLRRRVGSDTRLPFGALVAIGTWLTWLWGPLSGLPG